MKNTVPFTLGDYPLDLLDQATMRQLRTLADQDGVTVADVIGEAVALYAAAFAARQAKKNIIRFPAAELT